MRSGLVMAVPAAALFAVLTACGAGGNTPEGRGCGAGAVPRHGQVRARRRKARQVRGEVMQANGKSVEVHIDQSFAVSGTKDESKDAAGDTDGDAR